MKEQALRSAVTVGYLRRAAGKGSFRRGLNLLRYYANPLGFFEMPAFESIDCHCRIAVRIGEDAVAFAREYKWMHHNVVNSATVSGVTDRFTRASAFDQKRRKFDNAPVAIIISRILHTRNLKSSAMTEERSRSLSSALWRKRVEGTRRRRRAITGDVLPSTCIGRHVSRSRVRPQPHWVFLESAHFGLTSGRRMNNGRRWMRLFVSAQSK